MLTPAKKEFIEFMMSADVLRFGDFVTKSGRNTPYFVNTGLYRTGAAFFPTVPGTSSTIYNLPFMAVMLFCSTIFTRKLYSKTGSSIPGALMSAAVFTFVAIQSFAYYAI